MVLNIHSQMIYIYTLLLFWWV